MGFFKCILYIPQQMLRDVFSVLVSVANVHSIWIFLMYSLLDS